MALQPASVTRVLSVPSVTPPPPPPEPPSAPRVASYYLETQFTEHATVVCAVTLVGLVYAAFPSSGHASDAALKAILYIAILHVFSFAFYHTVARYFGKV